MIQEPGFPVPFRLLDAVKAVDETALLAVRLFHNAPAWQGLEAAAQACTLHQRYLKDFQDHAFLLSTGQIPLEPELLSGKTAIRCTLLGQGQMAALYSAQLTGPDFRLSMSLTIGHTPFGERFRRELLEPAYREIFHCLTADAH